MSKKLLNFIEIFIWMKLDNELTEVDIMIISWAFNYIDCIEWQLIIFEKSLTF